MTTAMSASLHCAAQELWQLAQAGKLGRDVLISNSSSSRSEQQQLMHSSKFCLAPLVSQHTLYCTANKVQVQ
jgi:hypothetical protein